MGVLTDCKFAALRGQGFTGTVSDMMIQWLQFNGATSNSIPDAWMEILVGLGLGGPVYGPELVDWDSLETQFEWIMTDGILTKSVDGSGNYSFMPEPLVVSGNTYKISYTKFNHTAGDPALRITGTTWVANYVKSADPDGSYTSTELANATGICQLGGTAARLSLLKWSVKEQISATGSGQRNDMWFQWLFINGYGAPSKQMNDMETDFWCSGGLLVPKPPSFASYNNDFDLGFPQ